jgi:hypothetical protein
MNDDVVSEISNPSTSVEWRKEEIRKSQRERVQARKNRKQNTGVANNWRKLASSIGTSLGEAGSTISSAVSEASSNRSLSSRNVVGTSSPPPSRPSGVAGASPMLSSRSMHGGRGGNGRAPAERRGSMGDGLKKTIHGAGMGDGLKKTIHGAGRALNNTMTGMSSNNGVKQLTPSQKIKAEVVDLQQHIIALKKGKQKLKGDARELLDENDYLARELDVSCGKQKRAAEEQEILAEKLLQSQELLMQFLINTTSNEVTASAKHMQRLREEAEIFLSENEEDTLN